jgi:hypothetical protein
VGAIMSRRRADHDDQYHRDAGFFPIGNKEEQHEAQSTKKNIKASTTLTVLSALTLMLSFAAVGMGIYNVVTNSAIKSDVEAIDIMHVKVQQMNEILVPPDDTHAAQVPTTSGNSLTRSDDTDGGTKLSALVASVTGQLKPLIQKIEDDISKVHADAGSGDRLESIETALGKAAVQNDGVTVTAATGMYNKFDALASSIGVNGDTADSNPDGLHTIITSLAKTTDINAISAALGDVAKTSEITAIKTALTDPTNGLTSIKTALTDTSTGIPSIKTALTAGDDSIKAVLTDGATSIKGVLTLGDNSLGSIKGALTDGATGLGSIKGELTNNAYGLYSIKNGLTASTTSLASIKGEIDAIKTELTDSDGSIASIKGELTDHTYGLGSIKTALTRADIDISFIKDALTDHGTGLYSINTALANLEDILSSLVDPEYMIRRGLFIIHRVISNIYSADILKVTDYISKAVGTRSTDTYAKLQISIEGTTYTDYTNSKQLTTGDAKEFTTSDSTEFIEVSGNTFNEDTTNALIRLLGSTDNNIFAQFGSVVKYYAYYFTLTADHSIDTAFQPISADTINLPVAKTSKGGSYEYTFACTGTGVNGAAVYGTPITSARADLTYAGPFPTDDVTDQDVSVTHGWTIAELNNDIFDGTLQTCDFTLKSGETGLAAAYVSPSQTISFTQPYIKTMSPTYSWDGKVALTYPTYGNIMEATRPVSDSPLTVTPFYGTTPATVPTVVAIDYRLDTDQALPSFPMNLQGGETSSVVKLKLSQGADATYTYENMATISMPYTITTEITCSPSTTAGVCIAANTEFDVAFGLEDNADTNVYHITFKIGTELKYAVKRSVDTTGDNAVVYSDIAVGGATTTPLVNDDDGTLSAAIDGSYTVEIQRQGPDDDVLILFNAPLHTLM